MAKRLVSRQGATLKATLRVADWTDEGDTAELYCGQFFIDEIKAQGPESTVTIKARSTPVGSKKESSGGDAMRTKKTRAWEATTLKTIAAQIAAEANVKLYFQLAQDISYQRRDQKEQSDLAFLPRLGWEDGGDIVLQAAGNIHLDPGSIDVPAHLASMFDRKTAACQQTTARP